jgi:hypothetical protein
MSLDKIRLSVLPVKREQIIELDSVAELEEFDPDYKKYN